MIDEKEAIERAISAANLSEGITDSKTKVAFALSSIAWCLIADRVKENEFADNIPRCKIEIGSHVGSLWRDRISGLIVCERHKRQYDTDHNEWSFEWEEVE